MGNGIATGKAIHAQQETQSIRMLAVFSASLILFLSFGLRSSFGLFIKPMGMTLGWDRSVLTMGIALQNLIWGITQPFVGMLADKFGTKRIIIIGGFTFTIGLFFMSLSYSPLVWYLSSGVLTGLALSGTAYVLILGAASRMTPVHVRGRVLGLISSLGMLGQFGVPWIAQRLIGPNGVVSALSTQNEAFHMFGPSLGASNLWAGTFQLLGLIMLSIIPLSFVFIPKTDAAPDIATGETASGSEPVEKVIRKAFRLRDFYLLTAGFGVCGFHVTFMFAHFPAYLIDRGLTAESGMLSLMVIGVFNVIGTYVWGHLADYRSIKNMLSFLFLLRAFIFAFLIFTPLTQASLLFFSAVIGFLWLGTVPMTMKLVGLMFGPYYVTTLFGITFAWHQITGFAGAWLGGVLFDRYSNYDAIWYSMIFISLMATVLNFLIHEHHYKKAA